MFNPPFDHDVKVTMRKGKARSQFLNPDGS